MKYHICREKMQLSRAKPGNPASQCIHRTEHPSYSSVFVTEFNPKYRNTDLLILLGNRSSQNTAESVF